MRSMLPNLIATQRVNDFLGHCLSDPLCLDSMSTSSKVHILTAFYNTFTDKTHVAIFLFATERVYFAQRRNVVFLAPQL